MKNFKNILLSLLLAIVGMPVFAEITDQSDHYFCGFDTKEEFELWKVIDLNGAAGNGNSVWWWDEGTQSAYISASYNHGVEDWLISPAVTLSGNKKYVIKVNMFCPSCCNIKFTMGSDQTVEGQTIVLSEPVAYEGDYYVKFALPENVQGGKYYFGLFNQAKQYEGQLHFKSFEVIEDNDGALSFTLKNKSTQQPAQNIAVSLVGTSVRYESRTVATNNEGKVKFDYLTPGEYRLDAALDGYYPVENQSFTVTKGQTGSHEVIITPIPVCTVKGKVIDEDNLPLENVSISLKGVKDYSAVTDSKGEFRLEGVRYDPEEYHLTISKDLKVSHTATLKIDKAEIDLQTLVLKDFIGTPVNIFAEPTERGLFLSWMMPLGEAVFAHDNGEFGGFYQLNAPYGYVGVSYREPVILKSMSWVVQDVEDEKLDICVFEYRKDGTLSPKPVYEAKGVKTKNYEYEENMSWNEYLFEEPIIAPYGCVLALGHANTISVALDYTYSTQNSVELISSDKGWRVCSVSNFFIRGNGVALSGDLTPQTEAEKIRAVSAPVFAKSPAKEILNQRFSFTIWRLLASDKENQSAWKQIGSDFKEVFFVDKSFNALPAGVYQYAVQSVYQSGKKSEICFSKEVEHKMYGSLALEIVSNTAINFARGTTVTLVNEDDAEYTYKATASDNDLVFEKVRKGKYQLTAVQDGFKPVVREVIISGVIQEETIELLLEPVAPYNMQTQQLAGTTDVELNWNTAGGIFDDFESMEDFAVNPAGKTGWIYIDADGGKTYGVKQCEKSPFPNMFSPMAFMAFNPTATTPNLLDYVQPHSGNKMMIDVALEEGGVNDDYMFSPELNFDTDFVFSFYAASGFYSMLGDEEFMVGYTTGEPKAENVVWLTEVEKVGALWTKYEYDIPKDARHTVIRCVSNQHMFFMVDDVFIGQREPDVFAMTTFKVFLDEEPFTSTTERSVTFPNLSTGKHIAKVQTVYPMYDQTRQFSAFTEIVFKVTEATGIETAETAVLYTYDELAQEIIPGIGVSRLELYDIQGRRCAVCQQGEVIRTGDLTGGVYVLKIVSNVEETYRKMLLN